MDYDQNISSDAMGSKTDSAEKSIEKLRLSERNKSESSASGQLKKSDGNSSGGVKQDVGPIGKGFGRENIANIMKKVSELFQSV